LASTATLLRKIKSIPSRGCIEGNYGLPGLLHGHRIEETAFAKGQGPDSRTITTLGGGNDDPAPFE